MNDRLGLWPAWQAEMEFTGISPRTILERQRLLERLAAVTDLADATRGDIMRLIGTRANGHGQPAPATRACYRSHMRTFYRWAVDEGFLQADPARRIPTVKVPQAKPRPTPVGLLLTILATAEEPVLTWVMLGCHLGLRCMEMAALTGPDIDLEAEWVRLKGKGNKERYVTPSAELSAHLATLLPADGFLHHRPDGEPYTARDVSRIGGRHMAACGAPPRQKMHTLRHLYLTTLLEASGGDLRMVQEAAGHASPNTTAIYTRVNTERAQTVARGIRYHQTA